MYVCVFLCVCLLEHGSTHVCLMTGETEMVRYPPWKKTSPTYWRRGLALLFSSVCMKQGTFGVSPATEYRAGSVGEVNHLRP